MIELSATESGVLFRVKVIPRSAKTGLAGELDGAVKLKLSSPPVDGAANAELVKILSKLFNVAPSAVRIIRGETSKSKLISIDGVDAADAAGFLNAFS